MFGWIAGRKKPKSKSEIKVHKSVTKQIEEIQKMKYKPHGKQPTPLERKVQSEIARGVREKPPKVTKMANGLIQTEYADGTVKITGTPWDKGILTREGGYGFIGTGITPGGIWHNGSSPNPLFDYNKLRKQAEEKIEDKRTDAERWADEWEKKHA